MSKLDIMEAKLKLNDYLANAPKNYYCEGKYTDKNGKSKLVDALVKAHTADLARQKFIKYFNKDEGTTIVTSCIRKPGYIEKQGGIL